MAEVCPHCENHCPADDLKCPRGMNHFGISEEEARANMSADKVAILLLRKCGHHLHHNFGHGNKEGKAEARPASPTLDALTEEEKATLISLLDKCLKGWQA